MKPPSFPTIVASLLSCMLATPVVAQDSNAGRNLAAACFTCHGTDGNSVQGIPPSLAGRNSGELVQAMKEFQSGKRPATIMHQQARGYNDAQLQLIAAYFASVKPAAPRLPSKP
jgi:sulfide dehydrogenase cytochrome subunit